MKKDLFIFIKGRRLKEVRDYKALTQEYIGECMKVSRQTVNNWEARQRLRMSQVDAQKLAAALGVNLSELVDDENPDTNNNTPITHNAEWVKIIAEKTKIIEQQSKLIDTLSNRIDELLKNQ